MKTQNEQKGETGFFFFCFSCWAFWFFAWCVCVLTGVFQRKRERERESGGVCVSSEMDVLKEEKVICGDPI